VNTHLTPKIEQLINERLQSGSYKSVTEVIEDAFEALTERDNFNAVRAELDQADEQLARSEYTEYDENTIQDLAAKIKARGQMRLVEERKSDNR
jgi:putative addiction module CopG family antidote